MITNHAYMSTIRGKHRQGKLSTNIDKCLKICYPQRSWNKADFLALTMRIGSSRRVARLFDNPSRNPNKESVMSKKNLAERAAHAVGERVSHKIGRGLAKRAVNLKIVQDELRTRPDVAK